MDDDVDVSLSAVDDRMLDECRGKLEVVLEQNRNLQIALQSARRIGAAIGILMATHKISDDRAFELLSTASQHTQRKLRDIADDVVLTGVLELPNGS